MDVFFRNQIIQNIEHIGTSPELSLKIMQAVNRPNVNISEVVAIVLDDPTICAQILRVANSSFYYRGERINNITGAVVHLGLENVRRILFAIEVIGVFKANSTLTFFNEVNFWKHSVGGALLSADFGTSWGDSDSESYYIAGLLRNMGVLAIRQFLPKEFHQIYDLIGRKKAPFRSASKETIGIDHREIAHLICIRWNLPERIVGAISSLTGPEAGYAAEQGIVRAVSLADAVLSAKGVNEWDPFYKPVKAVEDESILDQCEETLQHVDQIQQQLW